ncbi:MAG: transglycosylase SLT domain-containing protein [Bdellovibrionaceae bacterium]|nr:transglycosylase SLT domain-containing protein [Pseudobdellovibrionaceae bacterium]
MVKFPFSAILFCALTIAVSSSASANEALKKINGLVEGGRYSEAERLINKQVERKLEGREGEQVRYIQAWIQFRAGQYDKSLELIAESLKQNSLLEEEFRTLRAENLEKQSRWEEMLAEDKRIVEMAPNFYLRSEANLRTGRAYRAQGKVKEAQKIFTSLEKRARGTPEYPDVMIELAKTQRQMKNSSSACRWLRRLYKSHPTHPVTKEWGPDLVSNEFDGQRTGCTNTRGEFRDRLRALLFAGEEDKARKEVQEVAGALAEEDRASSDELRAWFLLQSGFPDEAYQLLEPSAPKKKNDADFLSVFASAAARSGNNPAAVGAYHRIWEMAPNKERGRKALYQSAFLSYQFRDYDGASRRFTEFIQKYPRSGLSRDARWNLAWITYLKGDFSEARKRFETIAKNRASSALREKARYWIAMSHIRQDRPDLAKPYLETVAEDKSGSYYGLLARQRLAKLPPTVAPKVDDLPPMMTPRTWGPLGSTSVLLPSADGWMISSGSVSEESESEESLAIEAQSPGDEVAESSSDEEASSDLVQETGRSEIAEEPPVPTKPPANARRIERARALIAMDRIDEARWELFEIERKTSSRDEMKTLIALYEEAGQWHRSSNIAFFRFASQRLNQGMTSAKDLWESAFPKAYEEAVSSSAKRYDLPPEFVWGIMRAESRYRKDAVSPVGALGLMQIMPGTGRRIASLVGDRGFSPPQLLQPETAVRMGSFYLRRLSNQFGNSIPLAAAGYNAGPHRVHSWLMAFGNLDYDEFVEHIPFLETREYVRRVVANALTYSELYDGTKNLVDLVGAVKAKGRPELAKKENWDPL